MSALFKVVVIAACWIGTVAIVQVARLDYTVTLDLAETR